MHGPGRKSLEPPFHEILNGHWLRAGRARAGTRGRGLLRTLRRRDQGILEPEIQTVDTDCGRAQLENFTRIDRVLAGAASVRNRELFVRAVPVVEPKGFHDK